MELILFSHVALACRDMSVTEAYYTKHFGFRRARVIGSGRDQVIFLGSRSATMYLELFAAKEGLPVPSPEGAGPEAPGFRHLAFQVDSVDTVVAGMGTDARITLGPLNFDSVIPGWRTVWLADPDGRVVEISQGFIDELSSPSSG